MPSSNGSLSTRSSVAMPGRFSAVRIVRAKSEPTTQVTTCDTDWDTAFDSQTALNQSKTSRDTSRDTEMTTGHLNSSSNNIATRRVYGLLTPHPSIFVSPAEQEFVSAQSSLPSTPGKGSDSTSQGDSKFATPEGSIASAHEIDSSNTPRTIVYKSCSSSSLNACSYVSVGVQTSLPYDPSLYMSTAPPSPMSPKATPRQKRTSDFVREGNRLARELEDDLRFFAQERRRLKRRLAYVEHSERELKSFLIPCAKSPDENENAESENVAIDRRFERVSRSRFAARIHLTPAISEYVKGKQPLAESTEGLTATSPIASSSSESSLASASTFGSATTGPSSASITSSSSGSQSIDTASRVPAFTFGEGSSASTVSSTQSDAQREEALDLAPNPERDPSTYLIWFDLETTDAICPAAKIRILEVAVLITDKNYRQLDKGISYLVHWPLTAEEIALEMSERVREMHEKSGLLSAYSSTPPKGRLTLLQVERRICKYLEKHGIEQNRLGLMAGAGVAFDRGMVRQHMEKLDAYFGYQVFDTTTLWHVIRRKYNRAKRFSVTCAHRALDDIMGSSREAKLYSELLLKPAGEVHWPTQSFRGI